MFSWEAEAEGSERAMGEGIKPELYWSDDGEEIRVTYKCGTIHYYGLETPWTFSDVWFGPSSTSQKSYNKV